MIGILQVNHLPQKFPDKNAEKKYQHEETDKPTKHHVYSNIISKQKFHMAHKAQNRNHADKNVLAERQYLHKAKHTHNTTKSQTCKNSSMYMATKLPPQELLHMKDLLPAKVTI